jgi:membrane associated rhomboid family serine protease
MANIFAFVKDRQTGHYEEITVHAKGVATHVNQFVGGLSEWYALVPFDLLHNPGSELLTIFTSMFLHANWLHIGSNMLYLWIFGSSVEETIGTIRYVVFYFCCGMAAAVTQIVSNPFSTTPMVGASGAVAGVMGAYLLLFPRARILTLVPVFIIFLTFRLPAYFIIGYWALLQFLNAYLLGGGEMLKGGGVAYFAHVGGFVAGLAFIVMIGMQGGRRPKVR